LFEVEVKGKNHLSLGKKQDKGQSNWTKDTTRFWAPARAGRKKKKTLREQLQKSFCSEALENVFPLSPVANSDSKLAE